MDNSSMILDWHGTQNEAFQYQAAVQNNCACEFDKQGVRTTECGAHQMFWNQQVADYLLFLRWWYGRAA